jgi:hypothetical protein
MKALYFFLYQVKLLHLIFRSIYFQGLLKRLYSHIPFIPLYHYPRDFLMDLCHLHRTFPCLFLHQSDRQLIHFDRHLKLTPHLINHCQVIVAISSFRSPQVRSPHKTSDRSIVLLLFHVVSPHLKVTVRCLNRFCSQ